MYDAIHILVKEVNSQEILAYQKEIERESNTLQTEEKTDIEVNNLTTNLILEKKLPTILKEIQEVIDRYLKVISKEEQNIRYTDLIEHEIYLEHDCLIKKPVRYMNLRLTDQLKKELKKMETIGSFRSHAAYIPYL